MDKPRLFLLDAYALVFRAYYALIRMPRVTSSGFNTSAIFGFVGTLEDLIKRENPSHMAVCFDPAGPTFRHEAFEQYKGERQATPEDIHKSIPIIKDIIRAYNIPILEADGFEADDVIGTMATRAAAQGYQVYMMTPDKDFGQLVTDDILQYKPSYRGQDFELRGPREVCARYDIDNTLQVIDLLALMGDKSDNIPGCPGIGEKGASKLIREFGSVEKIIENIPNLKGATQKKIQDNSEQILFSKFLATIRTDAPIAVQPSELLRREPDMPKLLEIFHQLEFRTLITRVKKRVTESRLEEAEKIRNSTNDNDLGGLFAFSEPEPAPEPVKIESAAQIIDNEEALSSLQLPSEGEIGLFTVADGEADMTARPLGWALATPDHSYWLPASLPGAAPFVASLLAAENLRIVSPQVKRDYVLLARLLSAAPLLRNYFDVTVAHYILQPDMRHYLPLLASQFLGAEIPSLPARQTLSSLPQEQLIAWATASAWAALRLRAPLEKQVADRQMSSLLNEIELPLIPVLADMELTGVRVDVSALNSAADSMRDKIADIEKNIYTIAGEEFNVGSPAKVGEILFDKLGLAAKPKKTKTGQYSTSEEELEKVAHLSPIVPLIIEYRQLKKLLNTYLIALPATINPLTGRIHTTYNQTVTATGRISSSDPNLQNIPVREAVGREIRRAFIPSEGNIFLSADYSQIELRLVADFAKEQDMLAAFAADRDIHAMTAAKIFHESLDSVTPEQRRKAKTANFGILYGISAFGLSQRLSIPRAEAKELIDNYFAKFPTIRTYIDQAIAHAREKGYVSTIAGRRRPLPDITSRNATVRSYAERNAVNAPIQGSAADIIKRAMVAIAAKMKEENMKSRMIMQVHDELNFDVLPSELPRLKAIVIEGMESAYQGGVRLTASVGTGPDWLSAH